MPKPKHALVILALASFLFSGQQLNGQDTFIKGTVSSEKGALIAGAQIWFDFGVRQFVELPPDVSATTNRIGKYVLRIPRSELEEYRGVGFYWVFAKGFDAKPIRINSFSDIPQEIDVTLHASKDLVFSVFDSDGKPVANAEIGPWHVEVTTNFFGYLPESLIKNLIVKTNSNAFVKFSGVTASKLKSISVSTARFGTQIHELDPNDLAEGKAKIRLSRVGDLEIRFVGNPEGLRLPEAVIWASKDSNTETNLKFHRYSKPDAKTNFTKPVEMKSIVAGKYRVRAICPDGFELIPTFPDLVEIRPNQKTVITAVIEKPVEIAGRVLSQKDEPIENVWVGIQYGKNLRHAIAKKTDRRGKFVAKVLPGDITIQVSSPLQANFVIDRPPRIRLKITKDHDETEIETIKVLVKPNR